MELHSSYRKGTARIVAIVSVLLGLVGMIQAQSPPEPAKLVEMRNVYEQQKLLVQKPILERYVKQLADLQKKLTVENKLELAVKARDARVRIEKRLAGEVSSPAPAGVGTPQSARGTIVLSAAEARLQGSLRMDRSRSQITNWMNSGCIATWSGQKAKPGEYDVYLEYSTPYRGGGDILISELNQEIKCRVPYTYRSVRVKAGSLRLGSAVGLSIRAQGSSRTSLMYLQRVTLVPKSNQ